MNILITGATGFIGKNLVYFLEKNEKISNLFLLVRDKEKASKLFKSEKIHILTLEDKKYIEEYDINKVIHLASYLTSKSDKDSLEKILNANIIFSTMLLNFIEDKKIDEFFNFGSFAEYRFGHKLESAYIYAATKTAYRNILDFYSKLKKFKYYNLIPFSVYGGVDTQKKVIDYLKESFDNEVDMTKGEQILDFIHVKDICDFVEKLLFHNNNIPNRTEFFLGTGVGTSIRELSQKLEKKYNRKCKINWGNLKYRENDIMFAVANLGNNIEYLNWRAKITLEKGI